MHVEGDSIEKVVLSDPGLGKREILDMSALGGTPCWIVLRKPMEAETLLGKRRRIKAIKMSPDRLREFAEHVNGIAAAKDRSAQGS